MKSPKIVTKLATQLTTAAALLLIVATTGAKAEETAVIPTTRERPTCELPIKIRRGEFETVQLGRQYMLDEVMVEFTGPIFGSADIEVIANGVAKSVVHVGWRTSALIDVNDRVNSLTFRHVGNGGRVKIRKLEILPCRMGFGYGCTGGGQPSGHCRDHKGNKCHPGFGGIGQYSSAADVLYDMGDVLYSLVEIMSADDNAKFIAPIRAEVGRALAIVEVRGDLSQETKDAITSLLGMLKQDQSWFDSLNNTQLTYDSGVEFASDVEVLKNMVK